MITPLITAPYIARVLGADKIGVYSYTYTIVNYFVLIAMLGINNYGSREIAKVRNDNNKVNSVASSLIVLHFIITIITTLILLLYIICFGKYKTIMLLQSINLLGALFDITWLYSGLEKFKSTVTKNSIIKILTVVLIIALVKTKKDLWLYVLLMSGGVFIGQILLWPKLFKMISLVKPDLNYIKKRY